MQTSDFKYRDKVIFVPHHANGNLDHPDVVSGQVSSTNSSYVFVKFDKQVAKIGWEGTTSQACNPDQLQKVG